MRALVLTAALLLLIPSCSGGGTGMVIDPRGTWNVYWTFTWDPQHHLPPPQMPVFMIWEVSGGPGTYQLTLVNALPGSTEPDIGPLIMNVSGSSFTVSDDYYDYEAEHEYSYVGSGTLSNTTLNGTWTETITSPMWVPPDPYVTSGTITGAKDV